MGFLDAKSFIGLTPTGRTATIPYYYPAMLFCNLRLLLLNNTVRLLLPISIIIAIIGRMTSCFIIPLHFNLYGVNEKKKSTPTDWEKL